MQVDAAPALLTALTGLPSPTTGGTRAVQRLLTGDLAGSLHYNPLAIPLTILFLGTVWGQLARALRRQRPRVPPWALRAWLSVLALAWVLKLFSDPSTW